MIMKTLRQVILALTFIVFSSCTLSGQERIQREIPIAPFEDVEIFAHFIVTFEQADEYSLTVEYPKNYDKRLVAEVRDNTLRLGFRNIYNFIDGRPTAHITAPSFNDLEIRGAAIIHFEGRFLGHECEIKLSGDSQLEDLNLKAQEISLKMSGASKFTHSILQCTEFESETSGASRFDVDVVSNHADVEISGASEGAFYLAAQKLELEGSGAAILGLKPFDDRLGNYFELDLSGAMDLDAGALPFTSINAFLSGASKAMVAPEKDLSVKMSGASRLQYRGNTQLRKSTNLSAGCKIEEIF